MKNKFVKAVVLLLSFVFLLTVLPACGTEQDNVIKIGFTDAGYGHEFLEDLIDKFETKYPEYKVKWDGDPKFYTRIPTYIENGSDYDIMFSMTQLWQQWAARGQLENLDSVYASVVDDVTIESKIIPEFISYGKSEGNDGVQHYYVMPWNDGVTGIVYNAGMFEKYGWKVPNTVDELVSLCSKIKSDTNNKVKPFVYPGQTPSYWEYLCCAWWAQYEGIDNFNYFLTYPNADVFSQQGRLKSLEAFEKLNLRESEGTNDTKCNAVKGSLSMTHIQAQMSFLSEEAAMIPDGAWIETESKNVLPEGFKMLMMKTPYIDSSHKVGMNWTSAGDFICVPSYSKHKEGAKKFIAFMCTEENLRAYSSFTNTMRPFKYNTEEVEANLSDFGKSVFAIWKDPKIQNIYEVSHSPLYTCGHVNKWPGLDSPYGVMLSTKEKKTAKDCYDLTIYFVNQKWQSWLKDV